MLAAKSGDDRDLSSEPPQVRPASSLLRRLLKVWGRVNVGKLPGPGSAELGPAPAPELLPGLLSLPPSFMIRWAMSLASCAESTRAIWLLLRAVCRERGREGTCGLVGCAAACCCCCSCCCLSSVNMAARGMSSSSPRSDEVLSASGSNTGDMAFIASLVLALLPDSAAADAPDSACCWLPCCAAACTWAACCCGAAAAAPAAAGSIATSPCPRAALAGCCCGCCCCVPIMRRTVCCQMLRSFSTFSGFSRKSAAPCSTARITSSGRGDRLINTSAMPDGDTALDTSPHDASASTTSKGCCPCCASWAMPCSRLERLVIVYWHCLN
mmetsp:Transcript_34269/g.86673  ORF Transcript_34269/g.86673 Transcript_34269/m.86673 type:complete len:326 (+) Transcript_34269:2367-3344(+)